MENLARSEDVRQVAIMPDVHLGRLINNGTVAATSDLVYPQMVGSDIGCGLSAMAFNGTGEFLGNAPQAQAIIREIYRAVPALKHRGGRILPAQLASLSR